MKLSDGEKLIVLMLAELLDPPIEQDERIDCKKLREALSTGNEWGIDHLIEWRIAGETVSDETKTRALDYLHMYKVVESDTEALSAEDQQRVGEATGGHHRFRGFDDRDVDQPHLNVARFAVDDLKWYERFAGRVVPAGYACVPYYEKMRRRFEIELRSRPTDGWSADQIIAIVNGPGSN